MKHYLSMSLALLLVPSLSFAGTLTSLKQDEVTNVFSDKTITTISAATLNGKVINNSFTGYFSKDGKAKGSFDKKPDNDPQTDTGTWKADSNGNFCYKWDHWDGAKEECVSIYKLRDRKSVV